MAGIGVPLQLRTRPRLVLLAAALGLVAWAVWTARSLLAGDPGADTVETVASCPLPSEAGERPQSGLVWVPGGRYTPGDSVYPEERPAGAVTVDGFWMDRTEVTNDQFAAFVQATGYVTVAERPVNLTQQPKGMPPELLQPGAVVFRIPERLEPGADVNSWWRYVPGAQWRQPGGPGTHIKGRGHYPVVAVTFEDAMAYARWKGRDLPTEAEWEWAARAATPAPMPSHEQPREANTWQGRFPLRNEGRDGHAGLAPVGCYAANTLGLFDMVGNVWELTRDRFHLHGQPTGAQPAGPQRSARQRVIKGGSFLCSPDYCMRYRPGSRQPQDEDLGTSHVGFRTVLRSHAAPAGPRS